MRTRANALTVVDHLHVVAGTGLADPIAAGLAVDLSSGGLEDLLDVRPGSGRTTRHEGRTIAGTLLAARDARTHEEEALSLELLGTANRIREVGVATIDDNVAGLEEGDELLDEVIDGGTGLDEEDDLAGALELAAELLDGPRADDLSACVKRSETGRR